jgi:hypothetical protein
VIRVKCVDAGNSMVEVEHDVWPTNLTAERARDLADAHFGCSALECAATLAVIAVLGSRLPTRVDE